MKRINIVLLSSVVLLTSACQVKPSAPLELVALSGQEVQQRFSSYTVESFNVLTDVTSFTFYSPNGEAEQVRLWEPRSGKWKINDQGQMCLAMEGGAFKCRHIYMKGEKLYKYRETKQGKLEKVVRYRQFIKGNVLPSRP